MSCNEIRNPVTAITEAEATGAIGEIFADIRETMEIPLITSIWRMLVDIEGALRPSWEATKALYETGQPQAALERLREEAPLPIPEPLRPGQLAGVGVSANDLLIIRAILDAYNRSNGLNLLALTALSTAPDGSPARDPVPPSPAPWPDFPPLLEKAEIPGGTWSLLQDIHDLSAISKEPGIATIWRHLSHWPGLLSLIYAGMAPLASDGKLRVSMEGVRAMADATGARIAHLRPDLGAIPERARRFLAEYAAEVHHIVTIALGVSKWLRDSDV